MTSWQVEKKPSGAGGEPDCGTAALELTINEANMLLPALIIRKAGCEGSAQAVMLGALLREAAARSGLLCATQSLVGGRSDERGIASSS